MSKVFTTSTPQHEEIKDEVTLEDQSLTDSGLPTVGQALPVTKRIAKPKVVATKCSFKDAKGEACKNSTKDASGLCHAHKNPKALKEPRTVKKPKVVTPTITTPEHEVFHILDMDKNLLLTCMKGVNGDRVVIKSEKM